MPMQRLSVEAGGAIPFLAFLFYQFKEKKHGKDDAAAGVLATA